jgi:hypothetical protein
MAVNPKMLVSERAVLLRINRLLKADGEMVKATRSDRWRPEMGDHYVVNFDRGAVVKKGIDLEAYARQLGLLEDYEEMRDE